jgi:hypothetical protein
MEQADEQVLRDILATIDRSLGFPIPDFETLVATDYLQDALLRCFEVMGEATKRLSASCRASHPEIPWREMAGLRDVSGLPESRNFLISRQVMSLCKTDKRLAPPSSPMGTEQCQNSQTGTFRQPCVMS